MYFVPTDNADIDYVEVEPVLMKICHKKRKVSFVWFLLLYLIFDVLAVEAISLHLISSKLDPGVDSASQPSCVQVPIWLMLYICLLKKSSLTNYISLPTGLCQS